MTKLKRQYVVVHASNRDRYLIASTLSEHNKLQYLVTDDYLFRYFLRGERSIPLKDVKISFRALLCSILYKISKRETLQSLKDKFLSEKASKVANRTNCSLFSYSYYGMPGFKYLKPSLEKILFQLHPHPLFIKRIYLEEIESLPISRTSLEQEKELSCSDKELNNMTIEAAIADRVIVASSFTKHTLESELALSNVSVVPYGVNSLDFPFKKRDFHSERLRCLFVGSVNQRKGLYYLCKAIALLQAKNLPIDFTIVGRGIIDKNLIDSTGVKANVKLNVDRSRLVSEYHQAHLFILPSICEGFGQVILEALSTGLPILSTPHTAAPDLITDSIEGFIIPISSTTAILEKIQYLNFNRGHLEKMSLNATDKASKFSDSYFSKQLISVLECRIS